MNMTGMILLIAVLVVVGILQSVSKNSKNKRLDGDTEGTHVVDFKISSSFKGYIANDHLYIKEGFDYGIWLIPKMREIDLTKATWVGFVAQGGSRLPNADFVHFYDKDDKQVGPTLTLSNVNQVRKLFEIIEKYAPHIRIEHSGTIV